MNGACGCVNGCVNGCVKPRRGRAVNAHCEHEPEVGMGRYAPHGAVALQAGLGQLQLPN